MAFILLRLLVLGVIAAAADDDHITWLTPPRGAVPCVVAAAERLQWRRPPPPLEEDRPRAKPYRRRGEEELKRLTDGVEVTRKRNGTEGVYQCAVPHQKGVVLGYPQRWKFASMDKQFSRHPQNGTARAGQPYALSCEVASSPAATVSWLRDGQSLSHDDRYIFLNNQLLFTQIRKEDAGVYKCVATNTYLNKNRISDSAWLRVEDPVDEEPALLDIQGGVNITAARHSRVRLLCLVTGWPRPKITWEITDSTGRTATMEYTEEIVDLTSLELDLEGVYKCSVDGYTHIYKTFNVTMTEPVTITLPPVSKEVIRASTVRFNCTATGRPAPTVTWYKDGQPLVLGGRFNLRSANFGSRYELVIGGVTSADAGIYQCFASSLGSVASGWASLGVGGASAAAPSGVRCWPLAARAVLIRWERPMGDVMAYTVQTTLPGWASLGVGGASAAAPSGVRCWPLAARVVLIRWERPMGDVMAYTVQTTLPAYPGQPHSNTEETITVSEPLTPYGFQVRAYIKGTGKNIASDMSEPPIVCQGQGVPVQISKKGEDSVLVSWKEFAQETPGVVQWMLQYRRDNSSQETNVTLPENVHSYTLPASAASPLQVRVLGSRSEEWLPLNLTLLPWSPTAGRDDAGEVSVVPRDVRVTGVWSRAFALRWRCERCEAYAFLVCARRPDGSSKCIDSYNNSATVDGLDPETEYEVEVQARIPGRATGGPFSLPQSVTTLREVPEMFKDLTWRFENATAVRVSWNAAPAKYSVSYSSELNVPVEMWDSIDTVGNTALNATAVRVSWNAAPAKYSVSYSSELNVPVEMWDSIDTVGNTALITDIDPTRDTYVMVTSYDPHVYSPIKTIPAQISEAKDLQSSFTRSGVEVRWAGGGPRVVRYSQNLTHSLDLWPSLNATGSSIEITNLDPSLPTYVMVAAPGQSQRSQVLTVPSRPVEPPSLFLGVGIGVGVCLLLILAAAAVCIWRKRKRAGTPLRARRRHSSANDDDDEEAAEMKTVGGRLANGGGSKDAGEPLLNGHVHITENPQTKTPNGNMKKGRMPFDLSRLEDPDSTLETVLDADASALTLDLLDTSRPPERPPEWPPERPPERPPEWPPERPPEWPPERPPAPEESFAKLPDDNMNSELTRSAFHTDNSKIQPTLQPNG